MGHTLTKAVVVDAANRNASDVVLLLRSSFLANHCLLLLSVATDTVLVDNASAMLMKLLLAMVVGVLVVLL